ncbi:protein downstream neighbor of son-like protein isoform X1 [Iris pallida]|uniref:Protein downstream neighbor of son-like protein isoform X1 n=1 Tax=Iris pallida TaxID=29817 RepID=A0AAX6H4G2_IRIPA|nr:protein downstream neighbor of son-like protein isoform X1 [Iris pallida]
MMCHRLSTSPATAGVGQLTSQSCYKKDQMFECASASSGIVDAMYSNALCSWTSTVFSSYNHYISNGLISCKKKKKTSYHEGSKIGKIHFEVFTTCLGRACVTSSMRDVRRIVKSTRTKGDSNSYDMEDIVMPLHAYINDPVAADIIHNEITFLGTIGNIIKTGSKVGDETNKVQCMKLMW